MGRPFTQQEREVLERLVEFAPEDQRRSLRDSLETAEAGDKCSCGCGSFRIENPGKKRAQHYLVAEGFVDRGEGKSPMSVMLFAANGTAEDLEVYAPEHATGDPPIPFPNANDIKA
jgi:hypothetical protein